MNDAIMKIINSQEDYKIFYEPNYETRHKLKNELKILQYKSLTEYTKSKTEKMIKCKDCKWYTSTKDSCNACCGEDPHSGCNSSFRRVQCRNYNCVNDDGYIYFYNDDDENIKYRWVPSGNILVIKKNIPYKFLNKNGISYKK